MSLAITARTAALAWCHAPRLREDGLLHPCARCFARMLRVLDGMPNAEAVPVVPWSVPGMWGRD